jgi:thiamine pyrophosphate-dependent acetolactate synthase large subunit-like protein
MLSAQMLGINGLITIANYCREWSDPRLIVVVLNNRDLNMVTWELRALGGSPKAYPLTPGRRCWSLCRNFRPSSPSLGRSCLAQ